MMEDEGRKDGRKEERKESLSIFYIIHIFLFIYHQFFLVLKKLRVQFVLFRDSKSKENGGREGGKVLTLENVNRQV